MGRGPVDTGHPTIRRAATATSRLLADRTGATSIEYALIGGFLSIAIAGGAQALGVKLDALFQHLVTKLG